MVRFRALMPALLAGLFAGCSSEHTAPSAALLKRFRPFQGVSGPDAVYLDVALVQIARADASRFRDLWTFLDEGADRGAVTLEKKGLLEENGIRMGRAGTSLPEELLELTHERRHCQGARRIEMKAGHDDRAIELGPVLPVSRFLVNLGEGETTSEFEQAQFCLAVRPILADRGRTKLRIVPKVKHADRGVMPWKPREDRSGWTFQIRQPTQEFEALAWEVTLDQGEHLIVGAREDRPETIGHAAFVRNDETPPVQRLLILKVIRPASEAAPANATAERTRQAVPLALQAAWPHVRGAMPD